MNDTVTTPLGTTEIELHEGRIRALRFSDAPGGPPRSEAGERVRAYFSGDLGALQGAPLDLSGSEFQLRVWSLLREIPAGETLTYGELAKLLDMPGAARAVGTANARNPAALFVPCHRVIGKGGLRGYAWGLERKRWLLDHERALG